MRNMTRYNKTAFWVCVAAVVCLIVLAIVLVRNSQRDGQELLDSNYQVAEILYDAPYYSFVQTKETAPIYSISDDYSLYERETAQDSAWSRKGDLYAVDYSKEKLDSFFDPLYNEADKWLNSISTIYRADTDDDNQRFYLVMQTRSDEVLIAVGYDMAENKHIRWLYRMTQNPGATASSTNT